MNYINCHSHTDTQTNAQTKKGKQNKRNDTKTRN